MTAIMGIMKRSNSEKFWSTNKSAPFHHAVDIECSTPRGSIFQRESWYSGQRISFVLEPSQSNCAKASTEKKQITEEIRRKMESIFLNIWANISVSSYRKNPKKAKKREFAIKKILYIIRRILYTFLSLMQILLLIISILIIIAVAIQAKWSGLSIIPGSGDFGKFERRGPEKILHNATIVLIILFVSIAILEYFLA